MAIVDIFLIFTFYPISEKGAVQTKVHTVKIVVKVNRSPAFASTQYVGAASFLSCSRVLSN